MKNNDIVLQEYGKLGEVNSTELCVNHSRAFSVQQIAQTLRERENLVMNRALGCDATIPRWRQVNDSCFDALWCPPELREPGLKRDGLISINQTLQVYKYEDPGRDWFNIFVNTDNV